MQMNMGHHPAIQRGSLTIAPQSCKALLAGEKISLYPKELDARNNIRSGCFLPNLFSNKNYRFKLIALLIYGTMRLVYFEHKKYNRRQYIIRRLVMDGYMTLREASEKWGITVRMVNYYCASGRIKGAVKVSTLWLIPQDAEKPEDKRRKDNKTMEVHP